MRAYANGLIDGCTKFIIYLKLLTDSDWCCLHTFHVRITLRQEYMEFGREIKTLRSSLITVKSSLEHTRSPELHYLTKELEKQLLFLNKIDQLLNKPNAAPGDLSKALENTTTESFTLVFDNRQALSKMDLSIFRGAKSPRSTETKSPSQPNIGRTSKDSFIDNPSITPSRNLINDPLQ